MDETADWTLTAAVAFSAAVDAELSEAVVASEFKLSMGMSKQSSC